MDSNKSIDGLTPRRVKSTANSHAKSSKPSTPKPSRKQSSPSTKSAKSTKTSKSVKTTKVTKSTKTPKTTKATRTTKTVKTAQPTPTESTLTPQAIDDFLQPVQAFNFNEDNNQLEAIDDPNTINHDTTENNSNMKHLKKAKKPSKKRKIIAGIIIAILSILIALVVGFIIWGNDIIAKITGGQGNVFDLIFTEETYEPLKTDTNGRTNILAFGTSGYNMEGDEGNGTHDGAQLTDSIMVISLDQNTGDIAMLSLPRDLKASPTCTATGKINEVYWCNGGGGDATIETEAAAAEALMDEVGSILGLDFQYFAHLNWGSLIQIVDTLGGINVTLDEDILDYYWTGAVFEAGVEYTINGEQALGLARARHGTSGGDFSRGASQQKILIGIKDKIFEKDLSLTDIISLAGTLGDNLRTNFSVSEMKTLAHLTSDFDFNSMRQISLIEPNRLMTTGNINGISYVIPVGGAGYYNRIQDYVAKMFSSDPKVYEDYSILVLNGTETTGLATYEQNTLLEDGYQNVYADNAPEGTYPNTYTLYAITDTAPHIQKLLEDKYHITAEPADNLPANISLNHDFILILGGEEDDITN